MCGILGYFTTTEEQARFAKSALPLILLKSEERGSSATGIAYINQGALTVIKKDISATDFIKDFGRFKAFMKNTALLPRTLIGHTRLPTTGSPLNNENNHPIFTKTGIAVVHNGTILNTEEQLKEEGIKMSGEVDTRAIPALIEHWAKQKKQPTINLIERTGGVLRGSQSCALIYKEEPDTLYLWKRKNPLYIVYHKPTGAIFFASDDDYIKDSVNGSKTYFHGLFGESLDDTIAETLREGYGFRLTPKSFVEIDLKIEPSPPIYTPNPAESEAEAHERRHNLYDNPPVNYMGGAHRVDRTPGIRRFEDFSNPHHFVVDKDGKYIVPQDRLKKVIDKPLDRPHLYPAKLIYGRMLVINGTVGNLNRAKRNDKAIGAYCNEWRRLFSTVRNDHTPDGWAVWGSRIQEAGGHTPKWLNDYRWKNDSEDSAFQKFIDSARKSKRRGKKLKRGRR
jgi:predicted glutamine amidotransferase